MLKKIYKFINRPSKIEQKLDVLIAEQKKTNALQEAAYKEMLRQNQLFETSLNHQMKANEIPNTLRESGQVAADINALGNLGTACGSALVMDCLNQGEPVYKDSPTGIAANDANYF